MKDIIQACNDYLDEKIPEAEFTRRLVSAINDNALQVEVAQCLADYLR